MPDPSVKCAEGHVWSNQFGDDWTPDYGMLCDCGGKGWGVPPAARPVEEVSPLSGREYCPRCSSGPRQLADVDECPDCGYKWAGPPLALLLKENGEPSNA